jgi:DNA-binding NarL/FixJ family response regulator
MTDHDPGPASANAPVRPIRIVLADDHPLLREGVARTLEESGRFAVVGEAATGAEAESLVAREKPDLLLLDISMPGAVSPPCGASWPATTRPAARCSPSPRRTTTSCRR